MHLCAETSHIPELCPLTVLLCVILYVFVVLDVGLEVGPKCPFCISSLAGINKEVGQTK
jgi:hypothetical protein